MDRDGLIRSVSSWRTDSSPARRFRAYLGRSGCLAALSTRELSGAAVAAALKREPERFLATIEIAIALGGDPGLRGRRSGGGGRAPAVARRPEIARGDPVERAGGPRDRDPAHQLLLPRSGLSSCRRRWPCAIPSPGRLTWRCRSPGWSVCVDAPSRVLMWSIRIVLIVIGHRETPLVPLVSEEEVKYLVPRGRVSGRVRGPRRANLVHCVFQFTEILLVRHVMSSRADHPGPRHLDAAGRGSEAGGLKLGHTRLPVASREPGADGGGGGDQGICCACSPPRRARPRCSSSSSTAPIFVPEVSPGQRTCSPDVSSGAGSTWPWWWTSTDRWSGSSPPRTCWKRSWERSTTRATARGAEIGHPVFPTAPISSTARRRSGISASRSGCGSTISPDYQTVAGFILHRLGVAPRSARDALDAAGHRWTVLDMEGLGS